MSGVSWWKRTINSCQSIRWLKSWKLPCRPSGRSCHKNTLTRWWQTFSSAWLPTRLWLSMVVTSSICSNSLHLQPRVGPGHTLSPLSIYFLSFPLFYFSLSFIGFHFLLLSIPSLSTRILPLRFQAGGRRRRPNLGLVCVLLCNLCYLHSLVKMDCGVLFYLV